MQPHPSEKQQPMVRKRPLREPPDLLHPVLGETSEEADEVPEIPA